MKNKTKRTIAVLTLNLSVFGTITSTGAVAAPANPTIISMPAYTLSGTTINYTASNWSDNTDRRDYFVVCTVARAEISPETDDDTVTANCKPLYLNQTPTNDLAIATDILTAYVPVLVSGVATRRLYDASLDGEYFAALSLNIDVGVSTETTGYSGEPAGDSDTLLSVPSPKIPTINQMASGSLLVTPGANAVLTGSRLNCTTYVKVNDLATTFTYSTLSDGSGQLSIAMPASLKTGKHTLTMDSCGGEVTYLNILTVAKAPVELKLDLANASDRALGLIQLRQFMREHRADYNTVTCTADSANTSQQRIANQVVTRYCHEAFSRLAMPMNRSTSVKSDYQGRSLILTVSLSNK